MTKIRKKSDKDPRGAFRNPTDFAGAVASVVGPLGSSSFNLPNVERAFSEMKSGIGPANTPDYKKIWRQSKYSWRPNWAPRLQPPVLVVYVHLGHDWRHP